MSGDGKSPLRRGWTTGACATASTRAAYEALLTGHFPDPVTITLPRGQQPAFPLARQELRADEAMAAIIKDAGDDPDVTHGALVQVTVRRGMAGTGITFRAGEGVGTVTRAGLPVTVGEPAINPVPRRLMRDTITELAARHGDGGEVEIEISIPDGQDLAKHTMNGRLGIVGGLSILGTTGIVVPFSCAAWIASIHQGVDVARAAGLSRVGAATGSTSEKAVRDLYDLPEVALLEMGDFAGGLLKYLRRHPLPYLSIAGGFAKIIKLAQGNMDLHSGRSQVDFQWLGALLAEIGATQEITNTCRKANTAMEVLGLAQNAGFPLADAVANRALNVARETAGPETRIEVLIFDREGHLAGRSDG